MKLRTITEGVLKQLLDTVDGIELEFVEVEIPADGQPLEEAEEVATFPENSKIPEKPERFFCQVHVPNQKGDRGPLTLLNWRGQVRFFNPYGCIRLIKDLGVSQARLKVTNPK